MPQGPSGLLPVDKIIRPEQVRGLTFLTQDERVRYEQGVANLRKKMADNPPDHPEHYTSHQRLSEVTNRLRQQAMRYHARQQQGGQGAPAVLQPQQAIQMQPRVEAAVQNPAGGQQGQQGQQFEFSERVRNEAKNLRVGIPPGLRSQPEAEQQKWMNGQRLKYARILHTFEQAENSMKQLSAQVQARQATNSLSQEDMLRARERMNLLNQRKTAAYNEANKLKADHLNLLSKIQMAAQQNTTNAGGVGQVAPTMQAAQARSSVDASQQDAIKPEELNPAIQDRANSATVPGNATLDQNTQAQGAQHQQAPSTSAGPPDATIAKPELNVSAQTSPATNQPSGARPLSHQDAIARASQNYPQTTPSHGHPGQSQGQMPAQESAPAPSSLNQRPQQRPLNVAPLQAVQMPPARPTLASGPGTVGPMGQPAIHKQPGFVLEGEGEGHVLSRKNLLELVRQVTGGPGNEEGEIMDPEAEQVR